jgi:hypothetical protein
MDQIGSHNGWQIGKKSRASSFQSAPPIVVANHQSMSVLLGLMFQSHAEQSTVSHEQWTESHDCRGVADSFA